MNADAIYVRGLCLYYEDNVDKAFTHFQQVYLIGTLYCLHSSKLSCLDELSYEPTYLDCRS